MPVFLAVILTFPSLTYYRNARNKWGKVTIWDAVDWHATHQPEMSASFLNVFERIFAAGKQIGKFVPYVDRFSGNNLKAIWEYGGSARYHTEAIDKVPMFVRHSSGITGISDAFLIGGAFLALVTVFLLSLMSICIDSRKVGFVTGSPAGQAMAAWFFCLLIVGGTWSWAFKGLAANLVWPCLFAFHGILTSGRAR